MPTRSRRALEKVSGANVFTTMSIGGNVKGMDDDAPKGESGLATMRCLKPAQSEQFYFLDDAKSFCRLCLEETTLAPRVHIAASSRQSHTNHTCREVVLDSLTLWLRRGYSVDNIVQCWSHALYHHNEFPRVPSLSDWRWSVLQRAERINELLTKLRDIGYIDLSLAVAPPDNTDTHYQSRRRLAFERLECIGDNSWGNNMSNRMMYLFPDRQWIHSQSSYSFNCFRDACEMNVNLEGMYELLDLGSLLPPAVREKVGSGKIKADVLESLMGELQIHMWGFEPELYDSVPYIEVNGEGEATVHAILQHVLTEIYDIIMLSYCQELSGTAIPLAKELAAKHIWSTNVIHKSKDRAGAAKRRGAYGSRKFVLPPLDVLPQDTEAQRLLRANMPNPLKKSLVPETIDRFTHGDVFEQLIPSMIITEKKIPLTPTSPQQTVEEAMILSNIAASFPQSVLAGDLQADKTPSASSDVHHSAKRFYSHNETVHAWNRCIGALKLPIALGEEGMPHIIAADEDEVYFRDSHYELSPTQSSSTSVAVEMARTSTVGSQGGMDAMLFTFPFLSQEREGLQQLQGLVVGGTLCLFEPSLLVPDDVRPPNAGVITDKNLFLGVFLNSRIEASTASVAEEYF